MRLFLRILLFLVLAFGLLFAGLYLTSDADPLPATVTDDPELPAVEIAGVRLHARQFGRSDEPAIIVLHGGPGGDFRSLLPLRALEDRWHLVFYDQRGAGLSERVAAEQLTLDHYVAELDAIVRALDGPVVLIGHSWGAMLAHAYAGQHGEALSHLVLIEPGFLSAQEQADWAARAGDFMGGAGMIWHGLRAGIAALHLDGPDDDAAIDHTWGQMVARFANAEGNPYHCPGEAYDSPTWRFGAVASQAAGQTRPEDLDRLSGGRDFAGPVLFLTGACDSWLGRPLQEPRLGDYANARLVDIPRAGHDVIDDQPQAALAAIRDFLREN
ncbi:alpha/beta hydrolase [Pseudooceanicola nitratireducens]|uniref:alpha/beta fold hydrolase n=1 Tax=Pseudooceanicola nitratireducens TaxID=517719 RepID=UPI001C96B35E|nr:alpha/beta hydrolase [Pseudooceanicola nitratireducens]MBY6165975.1 alpha/beta hydrolase [Pseudooceanicola nitratireducens]